MDIFESQVLNLVFERTTDWSFSEIILNGRMLMILSKVDGATTLDEIRKTLQMDIEEVKEAINNLARLNLVHPKATVPHPAQQKTIPDLEEPDSGTGRGMVFRGIRYAN